MQAPLAIIGFLCGVAAWSLGAESSGLWLAIVIFTVVPFTLVIIEPTTNKPLLAPGRDLNSPETELLVKWDRIHTVRSGLGLAAAAIFIWELVRA